MFEFRGEWSEETFEYCVKRLVRYTVSLVFIVFAVILCPFIFFLLQTVEFTWLFYGILAVFVGAFAIAFLFPGMFKNDIRRTVPARIFDEDGVIVMEISEDPIDAVSCEIEAVTRVIDHGTFYEVLFWGRRVHICLCQKDLLVKGTIEEFEALFEDKLERRT